MEPNEFKATLERLEMDAEAASEALGIHYTSVYRYMRGDRPIPRSVALAVANIEKLRARGLEPAGEFSAVAFAQHAVMAAAERLQRERDDYRARYERCRTSVMHAAEAMGVGDTEVVAGVLAMELQKGSEQA